MEKYNWSLEKIYKNVDEARIDIKNCDLVLEKLNSVDKKTENLKELVEIMVEASRLLEKLFCYSYMKRDEDSRISESQKLALEVNSLESRFSSACSFFEPFLMELSEKELEEFYAKDDNEKYRTHFEGVLRFKEHTLSEKEEALLANLGEMSNTGQNSFYMLSYADMDYGVVESKNNEKITPANLINFLLDENEEVRKEAFEKFNRTVSNFKNTYGTTLYSAVKNLTLYAKVKNYPSARYMELFKDCVPETVYDSLIESIEEYLPSLHKYYGLRKKALKKDKQYMWDMYINLDKNFNQKYPYEKAQELILEALKPLGDDYVEVVKRGFDDRWVDVYPRDGKAGGAYSWGSFDTDPYILMNYTDDLNSMFTLAHELGHSMHSYYSRTNNDYIYSSYKIFVAEVASTFNELLLLDYLIKNAKSKEERLYILNYYINMFVSTVFRQTMFAEIEKNAHKEVEDGNALTAEDFTRITKALNDKYYGENVEPHELADYLWARIPHFYNNFYVYKYATSFCAASYLSSMVLSGDKESLKKYREFLKDGCRHYPIEQLRSAGIDMEDKNSVGKALEVFKGLVDELEKELED
ncbi:MAG: oligoendopeptidase F [Peptoniphilaceae bacterium]|uniref:oligoendopeptidase F n=1 Tax=Parvimonas sp. TaxID=1944660 RepID=UPI0025ECA3E8|nr:oligoendopeptidase F [Parvimonas sp.]MCI5997842.1 oligoendopeptidase F [Parvimonas sp.]MDD7764551.1 oligoendopeptidase F [Peptoniphilaceae bacterium]MDY3050529.1 oligoendopeptidase F [Parvimonas sp.]